MCIQRPGFSLNSWHRHSSKPAWISVIFLVLQSDGTNLIHAAYSVVSGLRSLGYKPHVSSLPYSSAVWSLGALLCLGDLEQQLWHSLAIHPELPGKKKTMSLVWTSLLVALCWCWRAHCRNNPVTPFSSEASLLIWRGFTSQLHTQEGSSCRNQHRHGSCCWHCTDQA